jgi:NADH-quinone oxidoreductase subunit M
MTIQYAHFPFLTTILLSCVVGLFVILFTSKEDKQQIKWLGVLFSGIPLLIAIYLFFAYDQDLGGFQFAEKLNWIPSIGVTYFNAVDGFSLPLLLLTGIVFFTAVLSMWELEMRVKEFFALIFVLVTGVFGLFMSLDLFFIFVWYDVSLFPMYLLIAVWGSTRKEYGALKLTLYLLAGSALILPAILYLYAHSGKNTFDLLVLMQPDTFSPFQQKFAFFLFYIGFGILAGVWPLHTWSPPGHVAAPTAVSMIHAGVLMKVGAFGVLRLGLFLCPQGWLYWAQLMALLAAVGIVYGIFVGMAQTDLKFVVGYSSVSHMGIVGLGLATVTAEGLNGAVYQMFAHGIMTALFFSSVGYIYDRTHTRRMSELGGLSRIMPVVSGYFILAALTSIGIPCLASFWGELVVFLSSVRVYPVRGVAAVSALFLGALFMLRVIQKTFYGPQVEKYTHLPDISFSQGIPRLILAAVIVLFGLYPSLMFDMIETASVSFMGGLAK